MEFWPLAFKKIIFIITWTLILTLTFLNISLNPSSLRICSRSRQRSYKTTKISWGPHWISSRKNHSEIHKVDIEISFEKESDLQYNQVARHGFLDLSLCHQVYQHTFHSIKQKKYTNVIRNTEGNSCTCLWLMSNQLDMLLMEEPSKFA